jgi:ABC-2 type transport system ATP-binding protein
MIVVENLNKAFGATVAVDDISFAIEREEIFGLLGPNGAGKTTTIKITVGVLKPDGGRVQIAGTDPFRSAARINIGYAPQSLAIYDRLTAYENLAFFGRLYGLTGRRLADRVNWALDFAGLTDRKKSFAGTYSGGMKRRLNLAAALVHDPPVLMLDEPTVGIDPQSRNLIFESIEELRRQGKTIIYTTHYMEEAQRLCDRVAIIDHGKILALDTVPNLTEQHGGNSMIEADLMEIPSDTSDLPGRIEGNKLRIATGRPMEDLAKLTRSGLKVTELKIERPNLEMVFLNLTGRNLRD